MLFQKALYFGCNACGNCCRGYGIPVSHHDVSRLIAAHPELSLHELFRLKATDNALDPEAVLLDGAYWHLLLQRNSEACMFLGDDNRCTSYESRPQACRSFPFDRTPLGLLRILPDAMPVWEQYCDRDKVPRDLLRQARQDTRRGCSQFTEYRGLVQRWNRWAATEPEPQQLEDFIAFLIAYIEL